MLGAIIGDIIGSVYEVNNHRTTDFPLFTEASHVSDDSVLTLAVADSLLNKTSYFNSYRAWGRKFPDAGYGKFFKQWLHSDSEERGVSFGNGAAMRVSPVAYYCNTLEEVLTEARLSAEPTHGHQDAIQGAQAIAACIFLARTGSSREEIKQYVENTFGYALDKTLPWLREHNQFDSTAPGSVPEAITVFLLSDDYESTIRNAVSIGGDTDTIACMAGGIAEAFYQSIPDHMIREAVNRMPPEFKVILEKFMNTYIPAAAENLTRIR